MDFGIFTEFHTRDGKTQGEVFDEHFDEVQMAETLGIDTVWLGEYHFSPTRALLASPLLIGSAIASRTERIRIGMAVLVVPLINPLRLAEEAATLDHISGGRLEFGVGRSGLTQFYDGYSMDYGETRDRFFEGLEVVMKAWRNETFSHEGKYWNFQDVNVVPKPYQKPHPRTRLAASSIDTYPMLGKMGYPIFTTAISGIPQARERLADYRKAWKEAGHTGPDDVFIRMPVYVADTAQRAYDEPMPSVLHYQKVDAAIINAYAPNEEAAERTRAMGTTPLR